MTNYHAKGNASRISNVQIVRQERGARGWEYVSEEEERHDDEGGQALVRDEWVEAATRTTRTMAF